MILTRFSVSVDIDGQTYGIEASEPPRERLDAIEAADEQGAHLRKERESLLADLQYTTNAYDANAVIMSGKIPPAEKVAMAREQKELNRQARDLRNALADVDTKLRALTETPEHISKMYFDAMVAPGEGKAALERLTKTTGLSYLRLVMEIRRLIADAREKK